MSQENVEIVRRIYERWATGDFRAGYQDLDPGVEFVVRPEFPEFGEFTGPDGVSEYLRRLLDQWERLTIEAKQLRPAGNAILADVVQHGKGAASGIEGDTLFFMLFSFSNGRIIRIETIMEEVQALEAAGLPE